MDAQLEDRHDETLGNLVTDLSRVMTKRFDRRARELGLTRAQWRVLLRLRNRQGVNQSPLAELLGIEPITLARHIDRLQEKGWLERRADPNDRRVWLLYLDDSVQGVLDDMQEISDWNRDAALKGFSDADREQLVAALRRAKKNLADAEREEAAGGRHG